MLWDPEVESPASIAIIGAGPVGVEAALYGRFLGYDVDIYDTGRPARAATRWNRRSIEADVRSCTTSLGHAALQAQDERYLKPDLDRVFTGHQYADEYITPLAKTDLLHDFVHFNTPVIEVGRYRSSLDRFLAPLAGSYGRDHTPHLAPLAGSYGRDHTPHLAPLARSYGRGAGGEGLIISSLLQDRANDEFRLLVRSRDRGDYTARADIVLDCRGHLSGECGWGPSGCQSIGQVEVQDLSHRWLPGDAKFEAKFFDGKRVLLFGQSAQAKRFASEWVEFVTRESLDWKLVWLIPTVSVDSDKVALALAEQLSKQVDAPKRFSSLLTMGIDRIQQSPAGLWQLQLLQADDSTVEITGDLFAPFPNPRPTPSLGRELLPQSLPEALNPAETSQSDGEVLRVPNETTSDSSGLFYDDFPGWRVATHEPHYYKLGSLIQPHHASGLREAYNQIRDLFALLGARRDLDLYQHFDRQSLAEVIEPRD